jgi:hypothetical protein
MSMDMNILFRCLVLINMARVNGFGVLPLKSGIDDRLGSSSNFVGEERCQSSHCGFARDVELSVARWTDPRNDQLACRETGIRIALSDEDTILTYDIQ